jgi:hypothetical protein
VKTIQITLEERLLIRAAEERHAGGYALEPMVAGEFDVWLDEQDGSAP